MDRAQFSIGHPTPHDEPSVATYATAWLRRDALRILAPEVADLARRIGVQAPALRLSSARSRWGSCNARGEIRLSARLVHVPPELARYVVAHEVAHLVHLDHSPRFWALVGTLSRRIARRGASSRSGRRRWKRDRESEVDLRRDERRKRHREAGLELQLRASAPPSSSPVRVSRQAPSRAAKCDPPARAASQISRFGVCRFTISLLASSHSISRMPSTRLQSRSESESAERAIERLADRGQRPVRGSDEFSVGEHGSPGIPADAQGAEFRARRARVVSVRITC